MCCNNCNQLYLQKDVSRERNPMYSSRETGESSLDLLKSIIPDTRAYVVEENRVVRDVTEEVFGVRDVYYPLGRGEMYTIPLSEAIHYVSVGDDTYNMKNNNGYRAPKEEIPKGRIKQSNPIIQKRDELKNLIDKARIELQINSN